MSILPNINPNRSPLFPQYRFLTTSNNMPRTICVRTINQCLRICYKVRITTTRHIQRIVIFIQQLKHKHRLLFPIMSRVLNHDRIFQCQNHIRPRINLMRISNTLKFTLCMPITQTHRHYFTLWYCRQFITRTRILFSWNIMFCMTRRNRVITKIYCPTSI